MAVPRSWRPELALRYLAPGPHQGLLSGHHQVLDSGHHQNFVLPWLLQARFPSLSPKLLLEGELRLLGLRTFGPGSTRGFWLRLCFGHLLFSTLGFGVSLVTGTLVGHHSFTSNILINIITSISATGRCADMYNCGPTWVSIFSLLSNP